MKWYKFATIEDFQVWHEEVKQFLGLPKYGKNGLTGLTDETSLMTTDYTEAVIESDGVYALVDDEIAQQFSKGMSLSNTMPISRISKV
jgi:hypothetical protein